jgi:magnesium and cobalt transporter
MKKKIAGILDRFLPKPKNKQQLISILRATAKINILDTETLHMIERLLNVKDTRAKDIMVPRSQVVFMEHDSKFNHITEIIKQSGHSRFPVLGESYDEIIGVLLSKDLLSCTFNENGSTDNFSISMVMRQAVFIPEKKRLDSLLHEFRANKNHMAIVVDEYGGVTGIITIEDVLEQIVGDIEDEFDVVDTSPMIKQHSDNSFLVKSTTDLTTFNEFFESNFSSENFETIGGVVLRGFGYLPKRTESIQVANFTFTIVRADDRRIHLLQVVQDVNSQASTSTN